jgi:hypothetical protein
LQHLAGSLFIGKTVFSPVGQKKQNIWACIINFVTYYNLNTPIIALFGVINENKFIYG